MRLLELLSTTYPYEETDPDEYEFTTDAGIEYVVLMMTEGFEDDKGKYQEEVEVQFGIKTHGGVITKITKAGDAFKVFATVGKILKDHLAKNPECLNMLFSASLQEPTRVKLYDSFIKFLPKFLPGWSVDDIEDEFGQRRYILSKKDQPGDNK